jgi:hypothetical protein
MRDKTEAKIQQLCWMWYKNNYCLNHHNPKHVIFAVPNDSSSKEETMRKLATGMLAGVSDFIVIQPNKVLFFEVKTETGKQQPNQKDFESSVTALGFEYYLVRSLEQFKKIITETI